MATSISLGRHLLEHVPIRHVPARQPLVWLRQGWDDLRCCGWASLAHGVLVVTMGFVLLAVCSAHLYLVVAAVTGYLLVGPVMTTGLCELSRRRASGEPLGFDESLTAVARSPASFAQFGAVLAAIALIWLVASQAAFSSLLAAPGPGLDWDVLLWGSFTGDLSGAQTLAYVGSGAVLAAIVFVLSVVAVPIIIDRGATASEAMWVGVRAVRANLSAMIVWALLIAALTALSFVTMLIGMIVVMPVLGHATWHAYRDLVR
ncbi:MAG: DUF2189 domain-containing protein [Steroidobacteraceae bacterium]